MSASHDFDLHFAESALGWIGMAYGSSGVQRVTFGHTSQAAAKKYLENHLTGGGGVGCAGNENTVAEALLARLTDFAAGEFDEFLDVELDFSDLTAFQCRVLKHCRRIAYGETMSYGELATRAGNPGAARAAGSTMAANRWPLIVPCHRVVQAGGQLGSYSAPQGVNMKRRLLEMEAAGVLV